MDVYGTKFARKCKDEVEVQESERERKREEVMICIAKGCRVEGELHVPRKQGIMRRVVRKGVTVVRKGVNVRRR